MTTENSAPVQAQTTEAVPEESVQAQPAAKQETPAEAAVRRLKLKVNGRETELSEEAVIAMAQKGMASDEKFKSAAEERKRVESILKSFKDDPDKAIEALLGKPAEELYKERLAQKLERMSKDPKEIEIEELKSKLEAAERKEKIKLDAEQKAKLAQTTEYYAKYYDVEIPKAIKSAGLPANEETVGYFAEVLSDAIDNNIELPMSAVAEIVKDRYTGIHKSLLQSADVEQLLEYIGEEKAKAISAAYAKKRSKQSATKPAAQVTSSQETQEDKRFVSPDELRKQLEQWKNS